MSRSRPLITLFTDAGWHMHTKAGAWAAWAKFAEGRPTMRHSGLLKGEIKDNGVAEYKAMANGLDCVIRFFQPPPKTLILCQTDSEDLRYQLSNIMSPTTKEPERLLVLNFIRSLTTKNKVSIYAKHVKGHKGVSTPRNAVNTWCDAECRKHLLEAERVRKEQAA
jgi:ribonuclease HI